MYSRSRISSGEAKARSPRLSITSRVTFCASTASITAYTHSSM